MRSPELTRVSRGQEDAQLAHAIAHDLREPLRMVISFTGLLARRYKGRLDAEADEFIGYTVDGAHRLQYMLDELVAYLRLDSEARPRQLTDCAALIDDVLQRSRPVLEAEQAVITYDTLPTLQADRRQLGQAFHQLIDNAVKFRSKAPPRIHITALRQSGVWVFTVRDNGIGIEPQFRERIFLLFQRLHDAGKYAGQGSGLAFVKKIVERHGGRVWVESEPDQGSVFYLTLPDE
ncbi:MAG: ATP-binding protein [Candidatus Competibacteraceae bacterium]|jgi:light-regulated signal transduction histidine kinase (bacteriophytochrome)|nr:ATP-binding protein [Candidatus Competibacteraceae bacterium]